MDIIKPATYVLSYIVTLLIGWLLGRFLKTRGKIRCDLVKWEIGFHKPNGQGGFEPCIYKEAESSFYGIELDFFNEKDVQTALKNICVIFESAKKIRIRIAPKDYFHGDTNKSIINLPPRKLIRFGWSGIISGFQRNDLDNVINSKRAYFLGFLPNGRKIKKQIIKAPLINKLDKRFQKSIEISAD
jgi:hypothetical protein